jgi:hypothetical protein
MPRILTTITPHDGNDRTTVCDEHEWASLPVPEPFPVIPCPRCEVEHSEGEARYHALVITQPELFR